MAGIDQLVSGVNIDHSFPKTFQLTTPINGSHAYRFGMKPKNVTTICIPRPPTNTGGLFLYNNPLQVTNPLYLFQLAFASMVTSGCNFILRPFWQATIVGQIMVIKLPSPSDLSYRVILIPLKLSFLPWILLFTTCFGNRVVLLQAPRL